MVINIHILLTLILTDKRLNVTKDHQLLYVNSGACANEPINTHLMQRREFLPAIATTHRDQQKIDCLFVFGAESNKNNYENKHLSHVECVYIVESIYCIHLLHNRITRVGRFNHSRANSLKNTLISLCLPLRFSS